MVEETQNTDNCQYIESSEVEAVQPLDANVKTESYELNPLLDTLSSSSRKVTETENVVFKPMTEAESLIYPDDYTVDKLIFTLSRG